ncbi:hypothetical protein KQX54_021795 [Cotesia glomerata]|uniref:Uncharacterized protein n=1 Tax=Cotesia glomerata TaxID=32391 RepID=A0AAV7J9K5_COTGL|nr:hypothetical protein KQX54_021795 [Cotesia glomerata]
MEKRWNSELVEDWDSLQIISIVRSICQGVRQVALLSFFINLFRFQPSAIVAQSIIESRVPSLVSRASLSLTLEPKARQDELPANQGLMALQLDFTIARHPKTTSCFTPTDPIRRVNPNLREYLI